MRQRDFRLICNCQRHATLSGRALAALRNTSLQIRRGGLALLVGVPLAFGAIGIPIEAMSGPLSRVSVGAAAERTFRIFTTPRVRREFLAPRPVRRSLTLDLAKEAFFRSSVPYGSIIYREAKRNSLPPELVAAVVEAESDFRVRLVSDRNAQGLMQIVPSTGRLLGAEDLFNPEQNITAGTRYLRYLLDRFRDPRVALAAYNAGEGNVEKWGGIPPFPETLAYLERVSEHASLYRTRVHDTYRAGLLSEASIAP